MVCWCVFGNACSFPFSTMLSWLRKMVGVLFDWRKVGFKCTPDHTVALNISSRFGNSLRVPV